MSEYKRMSLHEENRMLKQLFNSTRLCFDEEGLEEILDSERFDVLFSRLGMYTIFDNKEGKPLTAYEVVGLLNKLSGG